MAPTVIAFAPSRVELLGNRTDYNGGVALAAAIDRGVTGTRLGLIEFCGLRSGDCFWMPSSRGEDHLTDETCEPRLWTEINNLIAAITH